MTRPAFSTICLLAATLQLPSARAQTEYERGADGRTYRVTTRWQQQPIATPRTENRERTVYRDRVVTELRDGYRAVYSPVTEYRMEPRWHNWWNPFGRPYVAYHMRPRTHWETRYERYQTPVTFRETVPVTETVQVRTLEPRFVEQQVRERVAVTPSAGTRMANRPALTRTPGSSQYGSTRVYNDPPRRSTSTRY